MRGSLHTRLRHLWRGVKQRCRNWLQRRAQWPDTAAPLSPRRAIIPLLLSRDSIRAAVAAEAERSGRPVLAVERAARAELETICADFSPATVALLDLLVSPALRHLYRHIELRGFERLTTLSRTHQLIYLPAHRSHVDYLLLSWALHRKGLALPHIAAGDNLNLPLLGPILRRGGAIFMRRRFLDDALYTELFRSYLSLMLQRGHTLEFFLEGGRSRTGRLLPARRGLLGMTLQAWQAAPERPLALVPVAINYDLCLDNSQYLRELAGAPKTRESLAGLLGASRNLLRRGDGAYVDIGEPLLIAPATHHAPLSGAALGIELLQRINACAVATPVARLATLLLTSDGISCDTAELNARYTRLSALLQALGVALPKRDPSADQAIHAALKRRQLSRIGPRISASERQAAGLCFYRNNIAHNLILPGLMLLFSARLPAPGKSTITRLLRGLLPYFNAEFHLPPALLEPDAISRIRRTLIDHGLLREEMRYLRIGDNPLALLLMRTVEPILLRHYLVVRILDQQPHIGTEQLLELATALARRLHPWFGHPAPDYADPRQIRQLVSQLEAGGLIQVEQDQARVRRDLRPLLRIGQRLLAATPLQECDRWLRSH
jgi:glycerol-3-phosphate O-acyltransferase